MMRGRFWARCFNAGGRGWGAMAVNVTTEVLWASRPATNPLLSCALRMRVSDPLSKP